MDWTQALTIIGIFSAFFIYLITRMDNKFEHMGERIGKVENHLIALEAESKSTNQRITDLKTDINQRLSTIEGYLVPKKVYRFVDRVEEHEEPKEE